MATPTTSRALRPLLLADDLLASRYRLARPVETGTPDGSRPALLWLAYDEVLARPVAVKVLAVGGRRGAAASRKFLQAAAAAGAVSHPVLARVYDAALEERPAERAGRPAGEIDVAYVVSEWVDGRTLATALDNGPWTPRKACILITDVADALSVAHESGIWHGRIHPGNVMLTGGSGVKLTDLAVSSTLPEQAMRRERAGDPHGPAADVRDLAAVLYALLTARWPSSATPQPSGGLPPALAGKNGPVRGKLISPAQVRAGIPRDLDDVIVRALDPQRAREAPALTTAAQLCDALDRALPVSPPPRGAAARTAGLRSAAARATPTRATPTRATPETARNTDTTRIPAPTTGATSAEQRAAWQSAAPGVTPSVPPTPALPRPAWQQPPSERETPSRAVSAVPPEFRRWLPLVGVLILLSVIAITFYSIGRGIGNIPPPDEPVIAASSPSPGGASTAGRPIPLTSAPIRDFDPPPGDGRERPGSVPNAHDGDASTAWETERYESDSFGGRKAGVGLLVDLGTPTAVSAVELAITPGSVVELRAADTAGEQAADYRTLGRGRSESGPLVLRAPAGTRARYYLIWITGLSSTEGRFSTSISEMRFLSG